MERELPRNVYYDKKSECYQVRFMRDGKTYYYGSYADPELAIAVAQQVRSENFTASAGPPEIAKGLAYMAKYVNLKEVAEGERPAVRAAIKFITKVETRGSNHGSSSSKNERPMGNACPTGRTNNNRSKRNGKQRS